MEPVESLRRRLAALTVAQRQRLERELGAPALDAAEVVAYVVPRAGRAPSIDELRSWARERLPEYMVPTAIEVLADLPLLPSGKVDRRALPAPARQTQAGGAARTPVEAVLAAIVADVLAVDQVGIDDDFFAIGGNSLLAARVVARVRDALHVELAVRALFEAPTVAGLAARVAAAAPAAPGVPLVRLAERADLPASPAQERLWVLEQLDPGAPTYHVPGCVRLRGRLDVDALTGALAAMVDRHEALRTGFVEVAGRLRQRIVPAVGAGLPVVDLRSVDGADRDAALAARRLALFTLPFDLGAPPLLRAELMRIADDDAVLLLCLHHLVCDGWSISVLTDELIRCYEALVAGAPSPLPALGWQYSDLAAWQGAELAAGAAERDLAYWRATLGDAPRLLDLPTDRPRPSVRSWRGARVPLTVPPALAEELRAVCRREGVTPFMALLAAWQLLLARRARQDDIVVGSPVAGRSRVEMEGVLGCFVNTLVLRGRIDGAATVRALFHQVRDTVLAAHQHQALPFEQLVDALAPERDLGRTPLFQVCFVLENTAGPGHRRGPSGIAVETIDVDTGAAKFDLTLSLEERDGSFVGGIEYATDLFDHASVAAMARHLLALLGGLLADTGRAVASVPTLPPDELAAVAAAGAPKVEYAVTERLHERFARQAALTPDAIALSFEGTHVRYDDLLAASRRLAARLRRHGVGPEVRVGLVVDRSIEMIVGLLGILEAGGAYVPLDPQYPRDRITFVLADAGCQVVVTRGAAAALVGDGPLLIDLDDPTLADELPIATAPGSVDDLCYVIYTSGSTGKPKGCLLTHRNVMRLYHATDGYYGFSASDVFSLFHSVAFDLSVWELWGGLLHGGRVVVVPHLVTRSPDEFLALLAAEGVTVLNQTPSAFRPLMAADEAGGPPLALREVIFAGEPLDLRSLAGWVARHPDGPRLVNMYGITETTVHVTYRLIDPAEVPTADASVIGPAMPDLALHLVDQHGQLVPDGIPGEIWVGGDGVARGYHGRADLTAQRFAAAPHGAPAAPTYRSGDLARWTPDGELEYLGRIDQQVKIRGFRIELGEIETVLRSLPGVRDAAVITMTRGSDLALAAYVVVDGGDVEALRPALAAALPEHMVPAVFVPLAAMPLTTHGKPDRRALPAPVVTSQRRSGDEAPVGDVERALAAAWATTLGVAQVGRHDNFFELGGDSILAIQAVSAARGAGLAVTVKQMFQRQTVASLAEVATAAGAAAVVADEGPAPLAPMQRWFLDQEVANAHHWNQAIRIAPAIGFDEAGLRAAVGAVVARHGALRARFVRIADETGAAGWRQELAASAEPAVSWHAVADDAAIAGIADGVQRSLDLEAGPLLRVAAFDRGDGAPAELLLVAHHAVIDAVSWRFVVDDLFAALGGATLAPATGWRAACEALAAIEPSDDDRTFWAAAAARAGAHALTAPAEPEIEGAVADIDVELDADATAALLAGVAAYRARPEDLLVAGLGQALAAAGAPGAVIAVEGHGREPIGDLDPSHVVGWFTSLVPVVLPAPAADPARAIQDGKEHIRAAASRARSAAALRDRGELAPALARPAICFNYLGQVDRGAGGPALLVDGPVGASRSPEARRAFRLEITARITGGRLRLTWSHGPSLDAGAVQQLAADHRAAVAGLIAHLASPTAGGLTPSDLPLAGLDQAGIDRRIGTGPAAAGVEDAYPLSPVQQGFLVRGLAVGGAAGVEQARYRIDGALDEDAFAQAWRAVFARHPALRTRFAWEQLDSALQVVERTVELPFTVVDWSTLPAAEQAARLDGLLAEDRHRGFDLARAPLSRLTLVRLAADRRELVWSHHHLILDGWSVQRVLHEVVTGYQDRLAGAAPAVSAPPQFRDWIAWWRGADAAATEAYWRGELGDVTAPTPLGIDRLPPALPVGALPVGAAAHREVVTRVPAAATAALRALAQRLGVTLGTLIEAAWALVLGQSAGSRDVVLGATVSGRGVDVAGVADMVGMLINVVPVRVAIAPERGLDAWLVDLHARGLARREHEHAAPSALHGWSRVAASLPLFDSLVVVENFPVHVRDLGALPGGLRVEAVGGSVHSGYPLTLLVAPGAELELVAAHDVRQLDAVEVDALIADLAAVLAALPTAAVVGDALAAARPRRWIDGDQLWRRRGGAPELLGAASEGATIAGLDVHPAEIAALLTAHPSVAAADVRLAGSPPRPRAQVVLADRGTSAADLRALLRSRLPEPLVPSIAIVETIGDLGDDDARDHAVVLPRTPVEQVIAGIWAELLDLPAVGATDDFFDLGGQSLLVVKMLSRLRRAFGLDVPAAIVLEHRTVQAIAAWIADRPVVAGTSVLSGTAPATSDDLPPLERLPARPHYQLSPYQLPEFYFAQLAPDSPMYNQLSCDVLLVGELDRGALVRAWQTIVDRHAVFRTRFAFVDGTPVQVVAPTVDVRQDDIWLDYTHIPDQDFEAESTKLAHQYAATVLDFFHGPLFVLKVASFPGQRHLIILLTNHVLWDEVSSINLGTEIVEAYNAHRAGRAPALPPVPVDYVDYAAWVNRCVAEGRFERQRRYWLDQFADRPEPFELPTDFPRPPHLTFVGSDVSGHLPRALVRRIAAELPTRFPGTTLSMFLHAVLNVLLARLSGSDDIVIGMPIANRGHEHLERVMGPFATGMPMRCRVDRAQSFADVLAHTREVTVGALDNYAYPSVIAIQEINPTWDPSRGRLFTVMYGLQHDKTRYWRELHWEGLETRRAPHLSAIGPLHATARTDLRLIVEPLGDDVIYSWSYNSDLFRHSTVERFADHYEHLIEQVLDQPGRAVGELALLRPAAADALAAALDGARTEVPAGDVASLIERTATTAPDRIAIVDGERTVGYRQLLAEASRWAHQLRAAGVDSDGEPLVALLLEPSAETAIAILAVLLAGAAYVPLSTEAPPARLAAILERTGASLLVTNRPDLAGAIAGDRTVLTMAGSPAQPSVPPLRAVSSQRRAVVYFTSGTTGEPKGIEIEHGGIVNTIAATQRATPLGADDAVLFIAPYHFDASLLELLWPLAAGARLVVTPGDETRDPAALAARVERHGVTILQTVPTMLDALVAGRSAGALPAMPTVRHVICGSAALTRDLRDRFHRTFGCTLANHYGPTEVTVDAARTDAAIDFDGDIVPLGRPLDNTTILVLDPGRRPVAPGVIGEIWVAGPGVARGYLGDPARTADHFVVDPTTGRRMYRTGDLGRVTPDGVVGFVGRVDRQVKVRGNRVELDEIEARLSAHPEVARCAVQAHGGDALVAHVELRDGDARVDGLRAVTLAQRPDLGREVTRLHVGAWPDFFAGDDILQQLWPRLAAERPEHQLLLLDDDDRVVAVGNTAPIAWDGSVADLPAGWSGGLVRAFAPGDRAADTLLVLAGVVARDAAGRGLGATVLRALKRLAAARGLTRVLAPVRPTAKAANPELDFAAWCGRRRDDGTAADPWIRVHEDLGARALAVELRSQIVRADLGRWRAWTGAALDRDGEHPVAGALAPVQVDLAAGVAEYADPCLWMEHPLAGDVPLPTAGPRELRAHLRAALPEYMVPEHVRVVARMPLTASGKIDLRALPAPSGLAERAPSPTPATGLQHALAAIWRDVLAIPAGAALGVSDDFFELGGHSIRAMQVIARIADQLGVRLALKDLIATPTIVGLERHLTAAGIPSETTP